MDSPGRQRLELHMQVQGSQIQTDTLTLEACFLQGGPYEIFLLGADTLCVLCNYLVLL